MKYAVLDFETTGSQPADAIIQVGLVIVEHDQIVDRYTSFVKPGLRIPSYISSLTGITDETVENAPALEDVIPEVQRRIYDCTLVGHQVAFDYGYLQRALDLCGYSPFAGRVLDTMDMLRILFPSLPSLALSNVSQSLGITHDRPHQADSDAEATASLWLRCLQRFGELPLLTAQRIASIFDDDPSDLSWFVAELLQRKETAVSADPDGGRYFRQFALNVDDWGDDDEVRTSEQTAAMQVPFEQFYAELKEALRRKFAVFEQREAQDRMIQEVSESFADDRHLMIEAGTGTGKSLGYLVPSLYYGVNQDKKVVVSTHTINLQEQLRQRDIPLLQDIFPVPFRASVLKGRSHYLCLRKFEQKLTYRDYEPAKDDRVTAAQMVVWLGETERGDEEELYIGSRGPDFWHTVSSDADSCLNRACPWFKKCFYHRARHDANTSDLIITNHSLLFTDIRAENRVLPAYKQLVIDEAHHFEEVATKHLGIEVGYSAFVSSLQWLYKDAKSGLLPSLRLKLTHADGAFAEKAGDWIAVIDEQSEQLVRVKEQWDELAALLYDLLGSRNPEAAGGEAGQLVHRMKQDSLPKQWSQLTAMEDNLYVVLSDALKQLEKMLNALKDEDEGYDIQAALTDLGGSVKELYRHRDALRFFMKRTDEDYVYWMEASPKYKMRSLHLMSVPTDVSPMLQQYFFEAKDSIIMTSATLSVDKSFQYTAEQLGLDVRGDEKLKTVMLPSPFNYRKQALVVIPRDFPGVKAKEDYFVAKLVESLRDVARETKGRMLVLFTSYKMLKQTYPDLKEQLLPYGIQVFGQGIDSGNRSKLTRLFQDTEAGVLLGTSSFWEGVDIPGEALSCLAIVRLPFQPPNHPIVEAKCEQIKKANQNPFMKFSVPQAVIRFKQGFGRLVRTASDRGIVIIYDTRVIDTQYGKYFLYSLPGPKIEHMPTEQLVPRIQQWMGEHQS